ncbi:hypothetical protein PACTADRAFT_35477 [Pachysolen tannophilus NRRL Y-2460]|uniref:Coronin n=1 Tax=Pachysolen tannophilus NRRL Y-2460 TaxID=669874 RepID=A0A1E4TPQ5_PACTA|nr:hypothetical protein PACTADRAFT_35477 [Pachysolen tannophilus NRRL Y-2460]
MSGKFVRASKYRHVFCQKAKKELSYENLKITTNAHDGNLIKVNAKYISACWQSGGGGAFAIIPLHEVGKAPDLVPLFRSSATVLDTDLSPFDDEVVVSAGDDGKISVWRIPTDFSFHNYVDENNEIKDIKQPLKTLQGHKRKVGALKFNPVVENILASSSLDYSVKIWNIETGEELITLQQKDAIQSFDWNYNGSKIATTSRDKKIRIWNVKTGELISEGPGHAGARASRVVWLGNTDRIATTGFGKLSDRQIGVWDINKIDAGPIGGFYTVDLSSGILMPMYDSSTKILYLAGKGDGNIRYYEFENDELFTLSEYQSVEPQRGFAIAPKYCVSLKDNELLKSYKTVNDSVIEPLSFICPRRGEFFQEDIYPDCPSKKPALTAEEWWNKNATCDGPVLVRLKDLYEGSDEPTFKASEKITEKTTTPASVPASVPAKADQPIEKKDTQVATDIERLKPKQNVDELLKASDKVTSLLDKVNNETEDTPSKNRKDVEEDEWNDQADDQLYKTSKSIVKDDVNHESVKEPVQEKPKVETPVETKSEEKVKAEPKVEPKVEKEIEITKPTTSVEPTAAPQVSKVAGAASGLKQNVEKLSQTVDRLHAILERLIEHNLEKDDRIKSLETKIDKLLEK